MKCIMILCLSLLCLLAACQPTPERPFVIQNDQEKMLETAQKVEGPQTEAEATQPDTVDFYERLGAPRLFQKKLSGTGGRLQVEVDAEVILPDAELPIIRVSVDHGTAFDVAGKGIASEDAMMISIDYATKMAINRRIRK